MTRLLLFLPLLGLLAGCSSSAKIVGAGLRVELLQVQRATDGVNVTWRINNPNVAFYLFSKSTFKVSLDGVPLGVLVENARIGVPPTSRYEHTSHLAVTGPAAQAVEQALARGHAQYRLEAVTLWWLLNDDDTEKLSVEGGSGRVTVVAQ
jgi:hypothetical protein